MSTPLIKPVGEDWTWLTDYVFATAEWTLNIPGDRECELGTGVKAFGRPRGDRQKFTRTIEFTTWGAGAIHVRAADGKGSCQVRLDIGKVGLITILDSKF